MKRIMPIALMSLFIIMAFGCATTGNKVKIIPIKDNPDISWDFSDIHRNRTMPE